MCNYDELAKKISLFDESDIVISNIEALDNEYLQEDLIKIYNCILANCDRPDILMHVIRFADRFRDKSTMYVLMDLLLKNFNIEIADKQDGIIQMRAMCAKALGNFKDTEPLQVLLYCLNNQSEHYKVRLNCADALGKIGDKYAVIPLIEIMKNEDEKSVYLRESAVSALGTLGDMRAIDPLVSILETKHGIMNKFTFLKERVLEALTKLTLGDNERTFRALKASLEDELPQIRIDAIEALMGMEHPKIVDTIKTCLSDEDNEVAKNALIALYNILGCDILDEVLSLPIYSQQLKQEAQLIKEEYETDE